MSGRPLGDREDTFKAYNQSGADINNARLIHCFTWVDSANVPGIRYASADGTANLADGILVSPRNANPLPNGRTGRIYTEYVLENVNTLGTTVNDDVYLDPAVPGSWTFTRPTVVGDDVQVVGRVLSVSATTGRIAFAFDPMINGAGTSGSISSLLLEDKPYHFPGQASVGWVRITGAVTDGDRIAIDGRIYEFDTAAPPGTIGAGADVRVGVSGGGGDQANNAAGCEAALVDAINGDASAVVYAVAMGGNGFVGLVAKVIGPVGDYTLTNPVDAGGVIFPSAATLAGGTGEVPQTMMERSYTITAADVVSLATVLGTTEIVVAGFPSTTAPTIMGVQAINAAGSTVVLDGATFTVRQAGAGFWVLCFAEHAGGALLAAGDRIVANLQISG